MKATNGVAGVLLSLIVLPGAVTIGASVMGPPIAIQEEGEWAVGLEYGYAESDLRAHGTCLQVPIEGSAVYTAEEVDIRQLSTRMVTANFAYGICDNWDLFLRLGTTDAQDHVNTRTVPFGGSAQRFEYEGSHGLAVGFGSRATFCHWGPWQFGGTMQVNWLDPGDSDLTWSDPADPNSTARGRMDIDLWQAQLALAATYQIDMFRFWAGPFLQFVQGDFDRSGQTFTEGVIAGGFTCSGDIEEMSQLGVHFGAIWEASERVDCWVEGQYANDSWVFGISAAIQPEKFLPRR